MGSGTHQVQIPSSVFVAPRTQTTTVPSNQILGCTKLTKMMDPTGSESLKVTVDITKDHYQAFFGY